MKAFVIDISFKKLHIFKYPMSESGAVEVPTQVKPPKKEKGQQQGQKELDIARANQLAEQALPFQQVGFMSDIFRGVPALQQTIGQTRTPGPTRGSQMLGLGIAGLGAVGQAGGFGNFFGGPRFS